MTIRRVSPGGGPATPSPPQPLLRRGRGPCDPRSGPARPPCAKQAFGWGCEPDRKPTDPPERVMTPRCGVKSPHRGAGPGTAQLFTEHGPSVSDTDALRTRTLTDPGTLSPQQRQELRPVIGARSEHTTVNRLHDHVSGRPGAPRRCATLEGREVSDAPRLRPPRPSRPAYAASRAAHRTALPTRPRDRPAIGRRRPGPAFGPGCRRAP